jgi:hypothetical protein
MRITSSSWPKWSALWRYRLWTKCTSLKARCRRGAQIRYVKTKDYLERCGAHGRLQALEHHAERLGIAKVEGLALRIDPGYRNLGLASMHVIAQRDRPRVYERPVEPVRHSLGA